MTTQIITCFKPIDREPMKSSSPDKINFRESTTTFESTDFESPESDCSIDYRDLSSGKESTDLTSCMKKSASVKNVAWDDNESLESSSVRSRSEKSDQYESSKSPIESEPQRPGFYTSTDFSEHQVNRLVKRLSEYDENLANILYNQTNDTATPVVAVDQEDLNKIKFLGRGQYCHVHSVTASSFLRPQEEGSDHSRKREIFALKSINPSRIDDDDALIMAATDLATEALALSELDHKNVIKLRGLCCETFSKSFMGLASGTSDRDASAKSLPGKSLNQSIKDLNRSLKKFASFKMEKPSSSKKIEGYFLVLDVLTEVLQERLARDRAIKEKTPNNYKTFKTKDKRKVEMFDRIERTTMGIVDAMRYIHSHDIVLRDLKPGNVGFDEERNVKLFDFGMAQKVSECDPDEICGSPRYMAPEIMRGEGYTLKVDVYSFGIMLYEMCALELPYANSHALMGLKEKKKFSLKSIFQKKPKPSPSSVTDNGDANSSDSMDDMPRANLLLDFYRKVAHDGLRPSNNTFTAVVPCPKMRTLITECWDAQPEKRPSFDEIATRLEAIFYS